MKHFPICWRLWSPAMQDKPGLVQDRGDLVPAAAVAVDVDRVSMLWRRSP
jgi:hypothetical protein